MAASFSRIMRLIQYYTALYYTVLPLLAMLTPTRRRLALPKSYCFTSHLSSDVCFLGYCYRHLSYVFFQISHAHDVIRVKIADQ